MRVDKIFSNLQGVKLFSSLDAWSGYYNITTPDDSSKYTTVNTEYGKHKFL